MRGWFGNWWPLGVTVLALTTPGTPSGAAEPSTAKQRAEAISALLSKELPGLVEVYKELHRSPELSLMEEKTSARLVAAMKGLGFEVTTGVGGHGVVCVLK